MMFVAGSRKIKILMGTLGGLVALAIIAFVFLIIPVIAIIKDVEAAQTKTTPIKDALLLYDLDKLESVLAGFRGDLETITRDVSKIKAFSFVPFIGAYISDAENLSSLSVESIDIGLKITNLVKPFAPSLGFKTASSKDALAGGQEKLVGLARAAPVLAAEVPGLKNDLERLRKKLDNVNPSRYPIEFRGRKIRSNIELIKDTITSFNSSLDDVSKFLTIMPTLMGMSGQKNYLIIFQNDKEIRPSGGFLTAYAIFTFDKGRITGTSASDSYFIDIDNKLSYYDPAPAIVTKYLKLSDNKLFFRDANLSPDFKESMAAVERIWNRSTKVPKVDGIIALDTHFVEKMLEMLGEVNIPGYTKFTKDNVVYELELFSSIRGTKLEKRQGRKDLIGLLMQQLLQKAFSAGGKQYLNLISGGWQEATEKHMLFSFHNPDAQALAEKLNFAGRIREFDGDYLHINDANFGGLKGNWFIKEDVEKYVVVQNDRVISTLKIDYENTGKYDRDLNTGYRDYVRVYVPLGSKLISSDGSIEPVTTGEDLGKTYFSGYVAVDPLQKVRITLKYESPRSAIQNNTYKLLVQKQPGTNNFKYSVKVGKNIEEFELLVDRAVEIKL
jgi:hypothetical protein